METGTLSADLPTPETFAKRRLAQAPKWLQRLVSNALAIIGWIGLPSTLLSTLSSFQFVIDGAAWLYRHAGAVRPVLAAAGEGIAFIVNLWREITHPLWEVLLGWLPVALPAWGPDALTLVALFLIGALRRWLMNVFALFTAGALMSGSRTMAGPEAPTGYMLLPRRFPYADYFAETGDRLSGKTLARTERLWRRWRSQVLCRAIAHARGSFLPRFRADVMRTQFSNYWLAVMDGQRVQYLYVAIAVAVACAFGVDAAYRAGLFQ